MRTSFVKTLHANFLSHWRSRPIKMVFFIAYFLDRFHGRNLIEWWLWTDLIFRGFFIFLFETDSNLSMRRRRNSKYALLVPACMHIISSFWKDRVCFYYWQLEFGIIMLRSLAIDYIIVKITATGAYINVIWKFIKKKCSVVFDNDLPLKLWDVLICKFSIFLSS